MKKLIAVLVLLLTSTVHADQQTKDTKLTHLMQLTGMSELLTQQRENGRKQAQAIIDQVLSQVNQQLSEIDDGTMSEIKQAAEKFIANVRPSWTVEEAVAAYGRFYGEQLTEGDVDKIIAYYKSPVGQKDIAASKSGMPKWIAFLTEKNQSTLKVAADAYIADLKAIVERAKLKKNPQ